ncbi:DUF779 domain-containing protein [Celeribacter litoreus]|uniref:DUF779 domain-containing protein n=1 Tax=Celeribacter litoreus TaxID=2876714 RepID=UPI001CCE989F|nr:DUF779 domain-containing protein [Celeribacter litoreus]MCA0044365.1 DUF779 domain-containing protein [Celeribacter litoreus]
MTIDRVIATEAAKELLAEIVADHGPVIFVQSGGCCDGSSPMCFKDGDYMIGSRDVKLGEIEGAPVYISESLFEIWRNSQMILDAGKGHGAGFSLDTGRGKCFLSKARVFTDEEYEALKAVESA